jgi:hypothetical protein
MHHPPQPPAPKYYSSQVTAHPPQNRSPPDRSPQPPPPAPDPTPHPPRFPVPTCPLSPPAAGPSRRPHPTTAPTPHSAPVGRKAGRSSAACAGSVSRVLGCSVARHPVCRSRGQFGSGRWAKPGLALSCHAFVRNAQSAGAAVDQPRRSELAGRARNGLQPLSGVALVWDIGWFPSVSRRYGEADSSAKQTKTLGQDFADGGVAAYVPGRSRRGRPSPLRAPGMLPVPVRPLLGAGAAPGRDGLVRWCRGCGTCHRWFAGWVRFPAKPFRGFGPRSRTRQSATTSRPPRARLDVSVMASISASCTTLAAGICQPQTSGRTRQWTTPC